MHTIQHEDVMGCFDGIKCAVIDKMCILLLRQYQQHNIENFTLNDAYSNTQILNEFHHLLQYLPLHSIFV